MDVWLGITSKEAAREILKRRKARVNFWAFCQYVDPKFFTDSKKHLKITADKLQKLSEGKIPKLMLSMPPRAGKSYIISRFCSWLLGNNPEGSIMRNCYAASLAYTFSRHVRKFIQEDKYLVLFPHVALSKTQGAVDDWALETSKTTAYFCAGVDGGISGKGCTLVSILDDPIKNFKDACSPTIRANAWDWKTSTHDARLEGDHCPEIIIATRWHKEDPSGMSLDLQPGEWEEITFPALDKKGNSFCEEIKSTEYYRKREKLLEDVIWEAEYQQNPISPAGILYPAEQLNYFTWDEVEKYENPKFPETWDGVIHYGDTADKGKDHLSSPIGKKKGEFVFITDVLFTQDSVEITEPLVAQQIIEQSPDISYIESNNGGRSFALNIRKLIKGKCKTSVRWKAATDNKQTRMLMKAGTIKTYFYFLAPGEYEHGSDYDRFMRQLTSIEKMVENQPDDSGDSLTGMATIMDKKGLQFA